MSMTEAELVGWLEELGIESFDGGASFTYDDAFEISIQLSDDRAILLLYAELAALPANLPSQVLRRLLRLDDLGTKTSGAALSLMDDNQTLALWRSDSLGLLSREVMTDRLTAFVACAVELRATIKELSESVSAQTVAAPSGGVMRV